MGMESSYFELTRMIERLHRRFLDVLRAKLNREGFDDLNAVQVLLMINIGDEEVVIRDLIDRGYYQGSNVSYNVKKLQEGGYLTEGRTPTDRRSVRVRVSDKGKEVCRKVLDLEDKLSECFTNGNNQNESVTAAIQSLRRLERIWADYIHYGDPGLGG